MPSQLGRKETPGYMSSQKPASETCEGIFRTAGSWEKSSSALKYNYTVGTWNLRGTLVPERRHFRLSMCLIKFSNTIERRSKNVLKYGGFAFPEQSIPRSIFTTRPSLKPSSSKSQPFHQASNANSKAPSFDYRRTPLRKRYVGWRHRLLYKSSRWRPLQ